MSTVELGHPAIRTAPVRLRRRRCRQVMVGPVPVGGDAPISVQSMCTTNTADVEATLRQIAELTAAGCDIVRVAVPSRDDAAALPRLVARSPIPVIADIHFQPRYVFAAIDAGCAAVRVNPGNIRKFDDRIADIAEHAGAAGVPIRIGVNAGSLDKRVLAKHGGVTPDALVESALWECSLFEEHGFTDLKLSVKHHDPMIAVAAYRTLAARCDYPLHLGVTEAGPATQGTIKSAVAFTLLLAEGIGDTIRVSLSAPPVEEVTAGIGILESLGLRERRLEIVSCPGCGRLQVDLYRLTAEVDAAFQDFPHPLRVAVMGCIVNGPGEARAADIGVSSGHGKGQIFVRGEVVATVPEHRIVDTLVEQAWKPRPPDTGAGHYKERKPSMTLSTNLARNAYEEELSRHWDDKQADDINLLLGETDGLYHHHYAVGEFNRNILHAPADDRETLILKEMHRLETEQVRLITDPLAALTPGNRVMDAGSGRGGTSFMVHDRFGCRVDGVNFCEHHNRFADELAAQRGCADKVTFHYANMVATPFDDATFDAVYTNETTMYVDLFEAFAEFSRLLTPGGRYVLTTWCRNDAVTRGCPEIEAIDRHYVCHIHPRGEYLRALAVHGLIVSHVRDLTSDAIPYWELRSHSRLRTGVEQHFLDAYRNNHLNYLVIVADKAVAR